MSKTSIKERNKAIRLAWEKEQALVSEGKGTRDWTEAQQKDILDPSKGKAYDDDGRAFEGQHMKSAAEYPEYQGNPDNIQFLTRKEHLEAHKGSWQNPTNWYYNPETKEFVDFGDSQPIPCKVLNLSEPVQGPSVEVQQDNETKDCSKQSGLARLEDQGSRLPKQNKSEHRSEIIAPKRAAVATPEIQESLGDKVLHAIYAAKEFAERHPTLMGFLKLAGLAAAAQYANSGKESGSSSKSSSLEILSSNPSSEDDHVDSSDMKSSDGVPSGRDYPDERASPEEHTVPAHGQRYHTKEGVIWKEKESYQRGGKHNHD